MHKHKKTFPKQAKNKLTSLIKLLTLTCTVTTLFVLIYRSASQVQLPHQPEFFQFYQKLHLPTSTVQVQHKNSSAMQQSGQLYLLTSYLTTEKAQMLTAILAKTTIPNRLITVSNMPTKRYFRIGPFTKYPKLHRATAILDAAGIHYRLSTEVAYTQ